MSLLVWPSFCDRLFLYSQISCYSYFFLAHRAGSTGISKDWGRFTCIKFSHIAPSRQHMTVPSQSSLRQLASFDAGPRNIRLASLCLSLGLWPPHSIPPPSSTCGVCAVRLWSLKLENSRHIGRALFYQITPRFDSAGRKYSCILRIFLYTLSQFSFISVFYSGSSRAIVVPVLVPFFLHSWLLRFFHFPQWARPGLAMLSIPIDLISATALIFSCYSWPSPPPHPHFLRPVLKTASPFPMRISDGNIFSSSLSLVLCCVPA